MNSIWHAIVQWFVTTDAQPKGAYDNTLIAIASVAGVIWTGGLIAMQLKSTSITLINGLDFLQTAFLGAVLGLLVTGVPLRIIAIAFCSFHTATAIRALRSAWNIRRAALAEAHVTNDTESSVQYAAWTLVSMIAYVGIILKPTQYFMCIFGWVLLFLGMQLVLSRLYGLNDDDFRRGKNLMYLLGLGSFVALVLILWPRL